MVVTKKGSGPVLRETSNGQSCNKLVSSSSGKMRPTKYIQSGGSEKLKPWIPSFRSSSSKEMIGGSSSRNSSAKNIPIKSRREPRKMASSQVDTVSSVSNNGENELHPDPTYTSHEAGTSSVGTSTTNHRGIIKKPGLGKQGSLAGPTISSKAKIISNVMKPGTSTSRTNLRNLNCNSISDGCSSSESSQNSKKNAATKRKSDEGFKGKKIGQSLLVNKQVSSSSSGVSINDSRRATNLPPSSVNAPRAQRGINCNNPRIRISSQDGGWDEPAIIIGQTNEPEVPNIVSRPSSSRQISARNNQRILNSYTQPDSISSGGSHRRFPDRPIEGGDVTHSLMNRNRSQQSSVMGDMDEVLTVIEMFGRGEDLSYAHLLILEENLHLRVRSMDPHRDMRLDIDNMSYEELLALEEKMGTVSTALTEDALNKCLKRSFFKSSMGDGDGDGDDVKCSICQEEYLVGDELRKLQCKHSYHSTCIRQWLRLKKWCPVCKIDAISSSSPTVIVKD